jgi:hypothetical protein
MYNKAWYSVKQLTAICLVESHGFVWSDRSDAVIIRHISNFLFLGLDFSYLTVIIDKNYIKMNNFLFFKLDFSYSLKLLCEAIDLLNIILNI